jgi:predicted nucleotidyltransferase
LTPVDFNVSPYPDVNLIVRSVYSRTQAILATKLVGLYLTGSLVHGDFDEGVSDIDLTAVLQSDLTPDEFASIQQMHDDLAGQFPEWDDRIEVCYVPVAALRNAKSDQRMIANISPGEPFHWTPLRPEWLVNWYDLREQGQVVFGVEPSRLIEPISRQEFVRCLAQHASSWNEWIEDMTRRQQQAYAILSMCRALYGVQHGQQVSKRKAALWTAERFPEWRELIHLAIAWRLSPEGPDTDHAGTLSETRRFIRDASALILTHREPGD